MKLKRYPSDLTLFKTDNYKPQQHYRNLKSWDNFTMHVPLWTQVLDHFFKDQKNLKFLELGSGNGLCANFMLDNYNCYLDTVDMEELRVVAVEGIDYEISTIQNLKPFIDKKRCQFHEMTTKNFLLNNQDKVYDFIYIDAAHTKEAVLYDAINSFPLLKPEGLMIFDDYGWGNCGEGIDAFLNIFEDYIEIFHKEWQVMIKKSKDFK